MGRDIEGMWYKDWFADERYLALYKHRNNADAAQLLDLIEHTIKPNHTARILDLACGAGRHSIALAKRGYTNVTGCDLSATLLAKAREAASKEGLDVSFVEADMRSFEGEYDIIVNLFTSFGYFDSDADNEAVIARVGKSLTKGGWFVHDFFNRRYVEQTLVPHSLKKLDDGETVEEFRFIENGRVNKRIELHCSGSTTEYFESVRLFAPDELTAMIERSEMKLVNRFGSYNGEAFIEERSARCISFSRKEY